MLLDCCIQGKALRRPSAWVTAITLGVASLGAVGAPATAASFLPAAALTTGRYYHTATTLPDGKVLVAGGNRPSGQGFVFLSAAELYDPATDTWTSAGTLAPALAYHAATLLPSGKVLLIGGCEPTEAAPPQVYDPATNAWSYAGTTVPLPRLFPTATLLADGRVLVVGGRYGSGGPSLKSAALFDPAMNTWSPVPDMSRERIAHTATLLPSGKVLVTGGLDAQSAQNARIATAELYDPVTNTWSSAGTLAHARDSHSATLLSDQTVLVAGGTGPIQRSFGTVTGYLSSAEIYAPDSNTWTSTSASDCEEQFEDETPPAPGCLANPRTGHTATLLGDGTVLAAGGINLDRDGSAEIYHAGSRTWSGAGAMSTPRELHTATLLKDGRALIVGGWNMYGVGTLASAEIYVPTPSPPGTLNVLRSGTGNVTSNPSGIACGADCSESYPVNAAVTLLATPLAGSVFSGWSGGCVGTGPCAMTLSTARSVTATFNVPGAGSPYSNQWVQKSYVAYYGRPADSAGLAYWANRMDQEGGSLSSIIAAFGTSNEFNRRYGGLNHVALVTRIYQQTLGRDPEQGGLDYYVGELQAGRRTLQAITLDVLNGATGLDALTVANRLDVANHYTGKIALGCAYGSELIGVASLTPVTFDSATTWTAKLGIESRCGP